MSQKWAIFVLIFDFILSSFCIFGRGTNKRELKIELKMMGKMVTVNTLKTKVQKNAFYLSGTLPKTQK